MRLRRYLVDQKEGNMTKKDLLKKSLDVRLYKRNIMLVLIVYIIIMALSLLFLTGRMYTYAVERVRALVTFSTVIGVLLLGYFVFKIWLTVTASEQCVFYKASLGETHFKYYGTYFTVYLKEGEDESVAVNTGALFTERYGGVFHLEEWKYKTALVAYNEEEKIAYVIGLVSDYPDIDLDKLNSKDE